MNQTFWTILTVVSALGMAACLYVMYATRHGHPGLKALDKDFQSLDMRFHYSAEQAFDCFENVGSAGQSMLMRLWLIDYAFIVFFGLAMIAITRNAAKIEAIGWAMVAAAALRALLDIVENLLLTRACAAYPSKRLDGAAALAGYVTSAKWIAMGIWVAGLFVSLFITAIQI